MALPGQYPNILKESLLRIQSQLVSEESEQQASAAGSQSTALQHLRLRQIHEAKLAIIDELLTSFSPTDGQEQGQQQQQQRRAPDSVLGQKIALQCIFSQTDNGNSDPHPLPSSGPSSLRDASPTSENAQNPFLSEVEAKRRLLVQNNDKALAARKAQQRWREQIRNDANKRREESLKLLNDIHQERDRARKLEEEARDRAQREEVARRAQIAAEAAERAAAEEEERRAREIECSVCFGTFDMGEAARLPCTHWYCLPHLAQAFESALNERRQFRCCNEPVPVEILATSSTTHGEFVERYILLMLEQSTPNPVYCCQPTCGAFIPPIMARGPDELICPDCHASVCRHCKGAAHGNRECQYDTNLNILNRLAARKGWRHCPRCNALIEKTFGCSRMTCRCGNSFTMY